MIRNLFIEIWRGGWPAGLAEVPGEGFWNPGDQEDEARDGVPLSLNLGKGAMDGCGMASRVC
ncbi:MAG: hypothetical protein RBU29_13310, partial [bacterium]|nr:hypothetical protein [bacterium]